MEKISAWFITLNFINITWQLFRAKDLERAMKVLGSMFSVDSVVLPEKYIKVVAEHHGVYYIFRTAFDNIL
ncbi:MBOAT family protein, partial [Aliarcobacter butzleri]